MLPNHSPLVKWATSVSKHTGTNRAGGAPWIPGPPPKCLICFNIDKLYGDAVVSKHSETKRNKPEHCRRSEVKQDGEELIRRGMQQKCHRSGKVEVAAEIFEDTLLVWRNLPKVPG
jgi:hypothetical protein